MMLKQPIGRGRMYDLLHRTGVYACMGIVALSIAMSGISLYSKPQMLNDSSLLASAQNDLPEGVSAVTSNEELQKL